MVWLAVLLTVFVVRLEAQNCPIANEPCDPPVDCGGGPCPSRAITVAGSCDQRDCTFHVTAVPASAQALLEKLQWSFSDGGTFTTRGDVAVIRHSYSSLLSTNPCTGQVASSVRVIVTPTFKDIGPASPQPACFGVARPPAFFGYNTNFWGLTVEFGATRQSEDGWRFIWDYGDGVAPTTNKLFDATCKTFARPGRYLVKMTSWNINDDPIVDETFQQYVEVPNLPPTAEFAVTMSGKTASVDAGATRDEPGVEERQAGIMTPTGPVICGNFRVNTEVTYEWDFGDGGFGQGLTSSHTYVAPGTYTVRLVAVDRVGSRSVKERTVTIPNDPPTAKFAFNCNGLDCDFDGGESTDDGSIKTYEWTFGSTTVITESPRTTYRFPSDGAKAVTLKTSDGTLASPLARAMPTVTSSAPTESLAFFPISPCRVFDSRPANTRLASGVVKSIPVTAAAGMTKCGIPATAKAAALNFVAFDPSGEGSLRAWHGTQPAPVASTLNWTVENAPRANNAIVQLASNGTVGALPYVIGTAGSTHLIVDAYGYYAPDTTPAAGARGPYGYTPVKPCRFYDSRSGPALSAGEVRYLKVDRAACGFPNGSAAVAANLVVLGSTIGGNATIFSSALGLPPEASTINFRPSINLANGAAVELGGRAGDDLGVKYAVSAGATTHILVDATGYFAPNGVLTYHAVAPCRLLDTRDAAYGVSRLSPGVGTNTTTVQVQGTCGIPRGAAAAALNVTAISPSSNGHLLMGRSDQVPEVTSTLNFRSIDPALANGAIVALSNLQRDLTVIASFSGPGAGMDLVLDVVGYYSESSQSLVATEAGQE